jgi:hypothetical protein
LFTGGPHPNELAASLGVDRKTLRKYTRPARAAGIEPGGPPMAETDWRTLATGYGFDLLLAQPCGCPNVARGRRRGASRPKAAAS